MTTRNVKIITATMLLSLMLAAYVPGARTSDIPTCPTVKELHAQTKGRYAEIIVFSPKWDNWKLTQIVDGWAIFQDFYDESYVPPPMRKYRAPDRSFMMAVRESTIRLTKYSSASDHRKVTEPLIKGRRLFSSGYAFGLVGDVQGKDRDGFPVLVRRAEAIYPNYSCSGVK
jgi:hypothetical protein